MTGRTDVRIDTPTNRDASHLKMVIELFFSRGPRSAFATADGQCWCDLHHSRLLPRAAPAESILRPPPPPAAAHLRGQRAHHVQRGQGD